MCHSNNAFEIAISFFIFQFRTTLIDSCMHSAKVKPFYFEISFYFYRFSELFSFRATTPAYFHIMIYSSTQFYHNFTITSIVFHSNIYPFYSRRFVTLFALFYFCSTKLNYYK